MNAMIVEDNPINLEVLRKTVSDLEEVSLLGAFSDPLQALAFAADHPVQLAMLDIEMPGMNGIDLAARLHALDPSIAIIFLTGHQDYAFDAFQVEAVSYLMKPYDRAAIQKAVLRAKRMADRPGAKRVFIRTFGNFDVFVDGAPIPFRSSKAKELLALLVDRQGGIVTTEEMLATLWEDRDGGDASLSLCRKVVQRLRQNLDSAGIGDILLSHGRGRSIDRSKVDCDYFQFLEGLPAGIQAFHGEYMCHYSWSEVTLANLLALSHLS